MVNPIHNSSSFLLGSPVNQDSFYQNLSSGNSPPLAASRFQPAIVSHWFPLVKIPLVQIPLVPFPEVVPNSQVPVVPQPRGCEYSVTSNPHPYQGGEIFNSAPQVENQSIGSHNSSGWFPGLTSRLQDSLPIQGFRTSKSPSPIRAPEVQVSVPDSSQ